MNQFKSLLLLVLLSIILVAIGGIVAGRNGAAVMFGISLIINFISYWNCDKIALRSYNAQELSQKDVPELFAMVKELAANAEIPMPKLYIVPTDVPNAFATGRNPDHAAVAVTEGLISLLDKDEIAGVISHELSHIKHRDTLIMTLAAALAMAISYIANMAQWVAIFGGGRDENGRSTNPLVLIVIMIVAPLAAMLVQMGLSRSREYMADASGADISGKPLALASALLKLDSYAHRKVIPDAQPTSSGMFIINPFAGISSWTSHLFSTHPSTEERVKRLRQMAADYRFR